MFNNNNNFNSKKPDKNLEGLYDFSVAGLYLYKSGI